MWQKSSVNIKGQEKFSAMKAILDGKLKNILEKELQGLDDMLMLLSAMKEKEDGQLIKKE